MRVEVLQGLRVAKCSHQNFHLRHHRSRLLRARRHSRERAHSFPVEAKILGVRLRQQNVVSVVHELPHRGRVFLGVPTRKALVGAVEKRHVGLGLHGLGNFAPLVRGGVHPRGVVRAGVEQKHRPGGRRGHVSQHPGQVEPAGGRVVVGVRLHVQARVLEDGHVVGPRRAWQVNGAALPPEPRQELPTQPQGPSPADRLHPPDAAFRKGYGLRPLLG